jgi:hypothetical protein
MIDPFAFLPWYFRLFTAGRLGQRAYKAAFISPKGRRVVNRILQRLQKNDTDFTAAFENVDHEVALHYLRLFHHFGSLEPYRALRIPVDIVHGETTFGAVHRSVGVFSGLWPQAQTHMLRRIGHLPLVLGAEQLVSILFPAAANASGAVDTPCAAQGKHAPFEDPGS